eukprot:jgi/Tetstr1/430396/TSEL_020206.t1
METLLGVRHLTKKGDYMFSFDLQDGFYALGIAEADRDYFTVDVRDNFLLFSAPMEQALHLRQRLAILLDDLGLQQNPTKGFWEPCQSGRHLGVDIDSASGMFYAPADKLDRLSRLATRLIGCATRNAMWLPVRELQSLAGQAQWWISVPGQSNGKPIHRPMETAYLHTDSSGYGWGGVLNELESRFGLHSIDRFASALNTLLNRCNAAWLDPTCEVVDSLHLSDADWRRENNRCNPPGPCYPTSCKTSSRVAQRRP